MFELFMASAVSRANTEHADGAVQVVSVTGPLVQGRDPFYDDYDAIRERTRIALESTARAVVLRINSPGGCLYGSLDTAKAIRADADRAGKPLYAFIDGDGCSAAYALACATDQVVLGSSSVVGSIGVIKAREDASLALSARGVSVTYIASGSKKSYGRPELEMSEAELADTQALVNQLAAPFIAYVAERRGLPIEVVSGYEAGEFTGPAAVQARLADRLMSLDALVASLATFNPGVSAMKMDEIVAALQAAAKSDDPKEQAGALKMLAAMTAGDDEPDGDEAPAEGEGDEEKPDAEADEEDDKDKEKDVPPPGATSAAGTVSASTAGGLAAELAAATRRIADLERRSERTQIDALLKGQPKALRAALSDKPLADVKAIIAALPKPGRLPVVTTLSTPQGTAAPASAEEKRKAAERGIDPRILEKIERQTRHGAVKKTSARTIGGVLYCDVPDDYDPAKYGLGAELPKH
jgi:ClpP class serine protease